MCHVLHYVSFHYVPPVLHCHIVLYHLTISIKVWCKVSPSAPSLSSSLGSEVQRGVNALDCRHIWSRRCDLSRCLGHVSLHDALLPGGGASSAVGREEEKEASRPSRRPVVAQRDVWLDYFLLFSSLTRGSNCFVTIKHFISLIGRVCNWKTELHVCHHSNLLIRCRRKTAVCILSLTSESLDCTWLPALSMFCLCVFEL